MKYTFSFFILSPKKRPSCCIKACEAKTCSKTQKWDLCDRRSSFPAITEFTNREDKNNMELDIIAAKDFIAGKFRNAGDFDFIPDEQLEEIISALVAIDDEYLRKIAEDDSPYDEEYVYEHMLKSVSSKFSRYQTYLMRLVDDYMDFMEQYLVSIDAVEWE